MKDDSEPHYMIDRLRLQYRKVFGALRSPEKEDRFNIVEKSSFEAIEKQSVYELSDGFSVSAGNIDLLRKKDPKKQVAFHFESPVAELVVLNKDTLDFIGAHEIKHASLALNQSRGVLHTNIHSFKLLAQKSYNKINEKITAQYHGIEKISEKDSKDHPALLDTAGAYYYYGSVRVLAVARDIAEMAYGTLSRQEERICDTFALRAFPETDLEELRDYLQEGSFEKNDHSINGEAIPDSSIPSREKTAKEFEETSATIFTRLIKTHPAPEARYDYLVKKQQNMF